MLQGKSWRSTLSGILTALVIVVKFVFKLEIPDEVVAGLLAVGVFVTGLFTKDPQVTGVPNATNPSDEATTPATK